VSPKRKDIAEKIIDDLVQGDKINPEVAGEMNLISLPKPITYISSWNVVS